MERVDNFIANIYRSVQLRGTDGFREAALRSLGVLIPFDGALWGTANFTSQVFHSVVTLGLREGYPRALERTKDVNPLLPQLMQHIGSAVDMASVVDDQRFYRSELYRRCFAEYGVERILSYIDIDPRSNIYTLVSLYRFDREHRFTEEEREIFERVAYHMVNAAQHALFLHLAAESGANPATSAAICDGHGLFYQAMPEFLDMVQQHYPGWRGRALPFAIPEPGERATENGLCIESESLNDLYCVRIWEERPTDTLPERDREIVTGVCKGMTFKQIAREMGLAPSTVSNRLYRIYRKLGVTSRSSLAKLVHGE